MLASVLSCQCSAASVQWYYDPDSEGRPRGPEGDCTRMIQRCFVAPIMALSGVVMAAGEPHDPESEPETPGPEASLLRREQQPPSQADLAVSGRLA